MSNLEYIESYFLQQLNQQQKNDFEKRCETDNSFAEEVAFYISARQALSQQLLEQKNQYWNEEPVIEKEISKIAPVKKLYQRKWFMYAAACFLLIVSVYIFEKPQSMQQIAGNYIKENYTHLSLEMGSADSLQQAIAAYNNKEYNKALLIFSSYSQNHPGDADPKKFTGLVYLAQQNYDKALEQFTALAQMKELHNNPGLFLQAVTLLERNEEDDKGKAKVLLQQVVQQNLDGESEATEWLEKL